MSYPDCDRSHYSSLETKTCQPIPYCWTKDYYDSSINIGKDIPGVVCATNNLASLYPNPNDMLKIKDFDIEKKVLALAIECIAGKTSDPGKPSFSNCKNKMMFLWIIVIIGIAIIAGILLRLFL
jgi:hypothetical protein